MPLQLKSGARIFCLAAAASGLAYAASSDLRLIQAVKKQDAESVRALLKQHIDVNASQGDGSTALHWAADLDNLTIADVLIRAGARAGAANDLGATPLYLACRNRSASMVDRLLAAGADANAKLLNGETVLMTCARTGESKAVKALLVHGADAKAKEPEHDQTALMWAAAQSHPEAVGMLIEFGADVRARSRVYSQTVVGEQTQRAGREGLNYTVQRGGMTPLLFAARNGDAESAKLLLAAGADANDSLADGTSALVLAAHSGQGSVAIALLEKGADPNAMGSGYTAMHAAVLRSDLNLVKAFLAHGADPNMKMTKGTPVRRDTTDYNLLAPLIGSTPYLLAARFLEPEIMKALVADGADPKITMPNGATPLMLAVGMGSSFEESRRGINVIDFGKVEPESQVLEAVKTAFELSGDVNAANQAGDTALHAAAAWGHDSVVQFLADHGAHLNAKNKSGLTALAAVSAPAKRKYQLAAAAGGGDSAGEDPAQAARLRTAALLRKLGATE
jgi:ankyrin repeat protein